MSAIRKISSAACVLLLSGAFQGSAMAADAQPSTGPVDNEQLAKSVKTALDREPALKVSEVYVETAGGKVYLTGLVDTRLERQEASAIAARVPGVSGVANDIGVKNGD